MKPILVRVSCTIEQGPKAVYINPNHVSAVLEMGGGDEGAGIVVLHNGIKFGVTDVNSLHKILDAFEMSLPTVPDAFHKAFPPLEDDDDEEDGDDLDMILA